MQNTMIIVKSDGTILQSSLLAVPQLEDLQKAVGGYIETVPFFSKYDGQPCVAFCNEEGKLNGLPTNDIATGLWIAAMDGLNPHDVLVGDIAIISADQAFLDNL